MDLQHRILFGAEFNAELERGRAIAAGAPPDQEPYPELRDTRRLKRQKASGTGGPAETNQSRGREWRHELRNSSGAAASSAKAFFAM